MSSSLLPDAVEENPTCDKILPKGYVLAFRRQTKLNVSLIETKTE